jgi:hypothetical protein
VNDGTLTKLTRSTRVRPSSLDTWARARICPAGESSTISSSASALCAPARLTRPARGTISPRSIAIVTTAMMPWPHIVL